VLRAGAAVFSLYPPQSDVFLHVLESLALGRNERLGKGFDKSFWPERMNYYLSSVGIQAVACMSAADGGRLIRMLAQGTLNVDERRKILLAWNWPVEATTPEMNRAVEYLEQIATAIAGCEQDRLLVISY